MDSTFNGGFGCRARMALVSLSVTMPLAGLLGCAKDRQIHHRDADVEVYSTIGERNCDPRWRTHDGDLAMDPRSRFYEPYNEDCPPMPADDPSSHQYMHLVDGKKGWKHWHDNGIRADLENPAWRDSLGEFAEISPAGEIQLNLDSAIRLAYANSPNHQSQLETLYLAALDVTVERFQLGTQVFGGYDAVYNHKGKLVPVALTYDTLAGSYVVTPPFEGIESNRLTLGSTGPNTPTLLAQRRYATAGQLLAGFANSFVVEFSGKDASLSSSLANFSFIQPLLRGAGRDIALEQLTFTERNLLANLRAYSQFRQGFYTLVTVGDISVAGPQRNSRTTNLTIFPGFGNVDGYVGLLQQLQQLRNAEDNLVLQQRSLKRLEAFVESGVIDLIQVEQFRQNIENDRSNLLQARNDFLRSLDNYKKETLGLPPNLPVELDDTLIRQFQLVDRDATNLQNSIADLQEIMGNIPEVPRMSDIRQALNEIETMLSDTKQQIVSAEADVASMKRQTSEGERSTKSKEETPTTGDSGPPANLPASVPDRAAEDIARMDKDLLDLNMRLEDLKKAYQELDVRVAGAEDSDANDLRDETTKLLGALKRVSQVAMLVQARARLESISIDPVTLDSDTALNIALSNRLDFMNGRAALVDSWRLIAVSADALQSVLNVTASGDIRTARNNPVSLRAPTSTLRMGLEFDAPFTRLIERNNYRESLIAYQRNRRALIQSKDSLHVGLRVILRQLDQLRQTLEIQRRSVAIAIRRVDLTQAQLEAPQRPAQPGQRPSPLGPTAAINLISAQAALRDTQNSFLRVWLGYYAARLRLARELGIMTLDPEGRPVEMPLPSSISNSMEDSQNLMPSFDLNVRAEELEPLPPQVPQDLVELVESLPEGFEFLGPSIPGPNERLANQSTVSVAPEIIRR